jgi:hypothetical protein
MRTDPRLRSAFVPALAASVVLGAPGALAPLGQEYTRFAGRCTF